MLKDPTKETYGGEVSRAAGLPSGTITPILARLEKLGLLTHRVEDIDPSHEGRPKRKYYSFTTDGAAQARVALARTYSSAPARAGVRRPGLAGGPS